MCWCWKNVFLKTKIKRFKKIQVHEKRKDNQKSKIGFCRNMPGPSQSHSVMPLFTPLRRDNYKINPNLPLRLVNCHCTAGRGVLTPGTKRSFVVRSASIRFLQYLHTNFVHSCEGSATFRSQPAGLNQPAQVNSESTRVKVPNLFCVR